MTLQNCDKIRYLLHLSVKDCKFLSTFEFLTVLLKVFLKTLQELKKVHFIMILLLVGALFGKVGKTFSGII